MADESNDATIGTRGNRNAKTRKKHEQFAGMTRHYYKYLQSVIQNDGHRKCALPVLCPVCVVQWWAAAAHRQGLEQRLFAVLAPLVPFLWDDVGFDALPGGGRGNQHGAWVQQPPCLQGVGTLCCGADTHVEAEEVCAPAHAEVGGLQWKHMAT